MNATATKNEMTGRDGETLEFMRGWFERRGYNLRRTGLHKLNAAELDLLAGKITGEIIDARNDARQSR